MSFFLPDALIWFGQVYRRRPEDEPGESLRLENHRLDLGCMT